MADARTVAAEFVSLATEQGKTVTPMQLLKLVYITHGFHLGLTGNPLVSNRIEAWKFGPVIPDLYHEIKMYRSNPVQTIKCQPESEDLNQNQREVIASVYKHYGDFSGVKLSGLTHREGTPWSKIYHPLSFGDEIPNDLIEDHYKEKLAA